MADFGLVGEHLLQLTNLDGGERHYLVKITEEANSQAHFNPTEATEALLGFLQPMQKVAKGLSGDGTDIDVALGVLQMSSKALKVVPLVGEGLSAISDLFQFVIGCTMLNRTETSLALQIEHIMTSTLAKAHRALRKQLWDEKLKAVDALLRTCLNHCLHVLAGREFDASEWQTQMTLVNPSIAQIVPMLNSYMEFLSSVSRVAQEATLKSIEGVPVFVDVPGELPAWPDMPAFCRMMVPLVAKYCLLLDCISRGYMLTGGRSHRIADSYMRDKDMFLNDLCKTGETIYKEGNQPGGPNNGWKHDMKRVGLLVLSTAHAAGGGPGGSGCPLWPGARRRRRTSCEICACLDGGIAEERLETAVRCAWQNVLTLEDPTFLALG